MKLLILDTKNGQHNSDLIILDQQNEGFKKIELGYVPELYFDSINQQLLEVETELGNSLENKTKYWLKFYSKNLKLKKQIETPVRPMYAGFPGRSTRVKSSKSGKYIYFLESAGHPTAIEIYRNFLHRFNREAGKIESSKIIIDSCMIDFNQIGDDENQFAFHLACEFPSAIAFGNFHSEQLEMLNLEQLDYRTFGAKETCGSYFSENRDYLYCINGEGKIFQIDLIKRKAEIFFQIKLKKNNFIPLQQVFLSNNELFVGVSANIEERGLSLASQIYHFSTITKKLISTIKLPFSIMNFVTTPDNFMLIGVSPYENAVVFIEIKTGKVLGIRENIGISPAEVLFIE